MAAYVVVAVGLAAVLWVTRWRAWWLVAAALAGALVAMAFGLTPGDVIDLIEGSE